MAELSERLARLSPVQRARWEAAMMARSHELSRSPEPPRRAAGTHFQLSFAQNRLWFLDRWAEGAGLHGLRAVLDWEGRVDLPALRHAFHGVVSRHDILRTTFTLMDDVPVQVVGPASAVDLAVVDLCGLPADRREGAVQEILSAESNSPFDLARGPLTRAVLLRTGPENAVFALALHHIIADGWSYAVLSRELSRAYTAEIEKRRADLPSLPLRFADHATSQREAADSATTAEMVAWWTDYLAGAPTELGLPTDRPVPGQPDYRAGTVSRLIGQSLTTGLRALSHRSGVTLFMTLLTAFNTVLSRWSGTTDLVVGTPTAGRGRPELDDLIGCFINTIAIRSDLSGAPSFDEVLVRTRASALAAYAHQDVPFERLVERLRVSREVGRSPVFQVLFGLQNSPRVRWDIPGVRLRTRPPANPTVYLDLSVTAEETSEGLHLVADFRRDLFDDATATRFLDHLNTVLAAVVADSACAVDKLPLSSAAELDRLRQVGGTPAARPADPLALFAQVVRSRPTAVAVTDNAVSLTFAELDERANRVANLLRARGIVRGGLVGVHADWSPDLIAAVLGVLKIGAAFVPMDLDLPSARIAALRADLGLSTVLAPGGSRADTGTVPVDVGTLAAWPSHDPCGQAAADDLAYVVFTSGSTGKPKGVGTPRGALVNYAAALHDEVAGSAGVAGWRFGALAAPGTDLGYTAIFPSLLHGGELVLVDRACALDGRRLAALLADRPLDLFKTTSTQLRLLLSQTPPESFLPTRWLVLGGESVTADLAEEVLAAGRCRLLCHYGPTETTVGCVAGEQTVAGSGILPIGRPLAGNRLYVLDAAGQPAPWGVPGELCVGGAQLARGYLGRPATTAERFVPDPYGPPGSRMYLTGDLVRWTNDGRLAFLGRRDRQVKIRGHRVELGEIEAALQDHPKVAAAAVELHTGGSGDQRVIAYVVGAVATENLREHLAQRLPAHMLPGAIVPMESLPLASNGKLDRTRLPEPPARSENAGPEATPSTPDEELLCGIWCDLLKLSAAGLDTDFFAAGGHSLLAVRAINRIEDAFGVTLPVRAIFEAPTPAGLAVAVRAARRPEVVSVGRQPIPSGDRRGPVPLTHAQRRLWFMDQLDPGNPLYTVTKVTEIDGPLRPAALIGAVRRLSERHEALRTVFVARRGVPEQMILDRSPIVPIMVDLSALAREVAEHTAVALAANEARRGFPLDAAPPVHYALIRLDECHHQFITSTHHIIQDLWSGDLLARELWHTYAALADGVEPVLPPVLAQCADVARWEQDVWRGKDRARLEAYWREQLADLPEPVDPTGAGRPAATVVPCATVPFTLADDETERLAAFGRAHHCTLFMTVLAAYTLLIHREAGIGDVVIGTDVTDRTSMRTEGVVGFFTNQIVLRNRLTGDETVRELMARVKDSTLDAYDHRDMPFDHIVAMLAPARGRHRAPMFSVEITFQRESAAVPAPAGLVLLDRAVHPEITTLDLSLHVVHGSAGLYGGLTYNADTTTAAVASRVLARLRHLLTEMAADPAATVSTVADRAERAERTDSGRRRAAASRASFGAAQHLLSRGKE